MEDKDFFSKCLNHSLFYDEPIIKPKDVPEGDKIDMG